MSSTVTPQLSLRSTIQVFDNEAASTSGGLHEHSFSKITDRGCLSGNRSLDGDESGHTPFYSQLASAGELVVREQGYTADEGPLTTSCG